MFNQDLEHCQVCGEDFQLEDMCRSELDGAWICNECAEVERFECGEDTSLTLEDILY